MRGAIGLITAIVVTMAAVGPTAGQSDRRQDFAPRWTFQTGATVRQEPLPVGDLVYIASQDGNLHAVAIETGEEVWRQPTGDGFPLPPVVADGVVYVANQAGPFHALDAETGEVLWSVEGISSLGNGGPAVGDGAVFINRFGEDGAILHALDQTTGEERWSAPLGRTTYNPPLVIDDTVYVTGAGEAMVPVVLAFDTATGEPRAGFAPETAMVLHVAAGDLLYGIGREGLHALDAASGEERWRFRPEQGRGGPWGVDGPTVDTGTLYVGTSIGQGGQPGDEPARPSVFALDAATGEQRWATEIEGGVGYGPVVAGQTIAVTAGPQNGLYTLDAGTGAVTWYAPQRTTIASAIGASDGILFVADQDGEVTAWEELAT